DDSGARHYRSQSPVTGTSRLFHISSERRQVTQVASFHRQSAWEMTNFVKFPCDEAVILTGSAKPHMASRQLWVLAAAILGSSMAFIDGTVVNVALPALQLALHATISQVQWVGRCYWLLGSA